MEKPNEEWKDIVKNILEMCYEEMTATGVVKPKFLILTKNNNLGVLLGFPWESQKDKKIAGTVASMAAIQVKAKVIFFVADCWMVKKDIKPGTQQERVKLATPPSEDPDRFEAIQITIIYPSGESSGYSSIYRTEKDGSIRLDPPEYMDGGKQFIVPPWEGKDGGQMLSNAVRKRPPLVSDN